MTPELEQQLCQLNPFQDEEMDSLLRDVLRRQNSMSSISEVLRSFIEIITQETMRPVDILKNAIFFQIWKFVKQIDFLSNVKEKHCIIRRLSLLSQEAKDEETDWPKP